MTPCRTSLRLAGLRPATGSSTPLRGFRRQLGRRWCAAAAAKKSYEPDPLLDQPCPVPREQQPMQEFKMLKETLMFDWADLPLPEFCLRLGAVWGAFLLALGLPVSVLTFDLQQQPVECLVAASTGSLFLVTVLVLRLYLGYSHIGSRLLSATVVYEETGWYDGQVWTKTPQMLMRDRLLGTYSVRPALRRLKYSLYSLAGAMALSVAFLALSPPPAAQSSGEPPFVSSAGMVAEDYWEAVRQFEPWGLTESGEAPTAEGRAGLQASHLLGTGPGVVYSSD